MSFEYTVEASDSASASYPISSRLSVCMPRKLRANRCSMQKRPGSHRKRAWSDALTRLQSSVEVLLRRAQNAGTVRDDLRATELIALLAAICQEAMTDHWTQRFRRRALTILFHGIRPTAAE